MSEVIRRVIAWLRGLFGTKVPEGPAFNRKQRRAIAFASSAEKRMRIERTALRVAKRHAHRRPSDNGAKYKRAYAAGYRIGSTDTVALIQSRIQKRKPLTWRKPEQVAA